MDVRGRQHLSVVVMLGFNQLLGEQVPSCAGCGAGKLHRNLGLAYWDVNRDKDKAEKAYLAAIKLNPTEPDTYLNLLDAAKSCNRTVEAKTLFELYRKDFPELAVLDKQFSPV